MVASDIISEIIKRMKFWGSSFPDSTTSFIPNTSGNSFYLIQNRGDNNLPVQIRLSNHGTYIETWTDRKELGDSFDRIDPAHSINISIVFVDNGKSITDDCESQVNCEGCALPVCKPQTFAGQNEIGRPFKVYQYVYQSNTITPRYINALAKAIFHARYNGDYIDPLRDLPRAAKPKEFVSTNLPKQKKPRYKQTENKQYNKNSNMNKKLIRLTESDLHRIVKESVNRILTEMDWKTVVNAANKSRADFKDMVTKDAMGKLDPYGTYSDLTGQYGPYDWFKRDVLKGHNTSLRWVNKDDEIKRKMKQADNLSRYADKAIKDRFGKESYYNNHNGIGKEYPEYNEIVKNKECYGEPEFLRYYPNDDYVRGDFDDYELTSMPQKYQDNAKEINDFQNGKFKYKKGKGWQKNESVSRKINQIVSECLKRFY